MTHQEIRGHFAGFFSSRGHKPVPSASLVPQDDPSVLLTTAGMQQFKPYMVGQKDVLKDFGSRRLCSIQKIFRTTDIDEVGDESHLTFFEMLGNFSIGDYFKKEAIEYAWDFLTDGMGLDPQRLFFTVFAGDEKTPEDIESQNLWRKTAGERVVIKKFDRADNFWGPTGSSGPCGPCSEVHYTFDNGRELEIWNLVFMEYFQDEKGVLHSLEPKNIDTGMGLERLAWVAQNTTSVFGTDLFAPLVKVASDIAAVGEDHPGVPSLRVLADHSRAAAFLAAEGVLPSNNGRGYVLRRIIRRALRHGLVLGINGLFLNQLIEKTIEEYGGLYSELRERQDDILSLIEDEERGFGRTLKRGLKELEKFLEKETGKTLSGFAAFTLYDTYGFPLELTREIAKERGCGVDTAGFDEALGEQRERSRQARSE